METFETFLIFLVVLTVAYLLYYGLMVSQEVIRATKDGQGVTEKFDISDMASIDHQEVKSVVETADGKFGVKSDRDTDNADVETDAQNAATDNAPAGDKDNADTKPADEDVSSSDIDDKDRGSDEPSASKAQEAAGASESQLTTDIVKYSKEINMAELMKLMESLNRENAAENESCLIEYQMAA